MPNDTTRRDLLSGFAAASLLASMDWAVPALAQGDADVPFTDIPATFNPANPNPTTRQFDIRTIDGLITPKDKFFALQHFDRPAVDAATYKLKLTGLVNKPAELTLAEIKTMKSTDLINGYECSGNSPRAIQALSSCGKFTGVRLSDMLKRVGVGAKAREAVFFGTDHGAADVVFRQQTFKLDQQFGRSITIEDAMQPDPLLAWNLNGEPLTRENGFPLRLIMPGRYGVSNVKWLSEIRLQQERYVGNYQARWYRTIRGVGGSGKDDGPDTQWIENEVTHLQLKSVIARVRKSGNAHTIMGFVLNDGTPLKSVEVQIDGGPWQKASMDSANTKYSWKLFSYKWEGAAPGEHTIVSRATDIDGAVQPTAAELSRKRTFLEDNSQFPRKIKIG
ncbi:MAG: molybdopterin-dependent oxidoreductase [Acidobacteriota bacterium]